jgi:hypothetical protein
MSELLNLLDMAYEAILQHVPHSELWILQVGLAVLAAFGLTLLLKGGKLFPAITALAFLVGGGVAGGFLATALGTALWPTVIVAWVISFSSCGWGCWWVSASPRSA